MNKFGWIPIIGDTCNDHKAQAKPRVFIANFNKIWRLKTQGLSGARKLEVFKSNYKQIFQKSFCYISQRRHRL